ncbi:MAG: hypothetical protein BWY22_02052 [Bacteroidetes bacterium ADurb.Bin217]|nr:MAG: hypothetical protein BWY22_02052 [Bacteroidetes bacterium ADurb.Bin217]
MKIKPILSSQAPQGEIANAIKELENFFNGEQIIINKEDIEEKPVQTIEIEQNPNEPYSVTLRCPLCPQRVCILDFYYYYNPTLSHISAYRNAIWIHINKGDNWIYVITNNNQRKKAIILSQNNIGGTKFPQVPNTFLGIPNTNPQFVVNKTYWYEKRGVRQIGYNALFNEILHRLPVVC